MIDEDTAIVVRDLALSSADPNELEPGKIYGWLAGGQVHKMDLTGDQYRDYPRHKRGTVTVADVPGFEAYYGKHADEHSEVFADLDAATITSVLDAHRDATSIDAARWQQHRLVLDLQYTGPWTAWTRADGAMMKQAEFAEFLEDHAGDVAAGGKVSAADLLEVAQTFQAHTAVEFKAGHRLASGQTQLAYVETTEAKAGNRGQIEIPGEFVLAIVPFDDCAPRGIRARFRYRLAGGALTLGFRLDDPQGTARRAVQEVADKLAAACGVTVMHGRPAA